MTADPAIRRARVPLQCPLCGGLLQIDTALAGQHVACPLCQANVEIYQDEINRKQGTKLAMPVASFCTGPCEMASLMSLHRSR